MTNFNASSFRFFERKVAQGIALSDFSGSLIIPYQELPGNYNAFLILERILVIIPYQELPGNYNILRGRYASGSIIPYQELPENYNMDRSAPLPAAIIPYQELPGNYNMPFPLRKRSGIIPCKDLTVRTPALLLGNFCVAFFVRSGYNSIRRLSIALSAFSGRGNVGM